MARRTKGLGAAIVAVFAAFVVAVLGTLQHQTQLATGAPLGLIFGLSLVFIGAAFIRDRSSGKGPALTYMATLAILVFLFGQSFTQDVMIPNNDLGLIWSYGSIAVAMPVALWPRFKSHKSR